MANKKLSAVITIGGAISSTLGNAFGRIRAETTKVGEAVQKLTSRQRELNRLIQDQEKLGRAGSALKVQYAQQELAVIGRQIEALKRKEAQEKRIADAQKANLDKRAALRGKIGDTLAIGAAVMLPAGAALNKSAEFNYQLQAIGNTADMTKPAIAALGLEILKISEQTGKSAQDVQAAMGFLVAAGMEVGTASAVLRPVGRTATATASEIEDVAKATFTLNDALKINPTQMQRALDVLVQSGKEGNFEFKDMAAELPVLAAGMQSLKMTGTDAVATLGAALQIARKGAGTSQQAATNVENFLAKVMSPETLKKASKNFGVDLYKIIADAQKKGENPFEAAIMAINKMTKGGDQKLLGELFQDMQVQNFLRPMLQNLDEYQRIKKAALGANGVTDRDFVKMMDTAKKQIDEGTNAFGRMALAIGNALEPAVGQLLAVVTPVVNGIAEFVRENSALVGGAIVVTGSLLTMRLAVLGAGFAWTFIKGAALAVVPLFGQLATGVRLVGAALMWSGKALLWVGRALLMNPIGLTVTAIAAAVFLIYKYWEPLKAFFSSLWDGIKSTFASVYDWIVGKISYLMELPGKIKAKVSGWFGGDSEAGGSASTPAKSPASGGLPAVPQVSARGGTTVNDSSQTSIFITQQPGQDPKALAAEIERQRRAKAGVRSRSIMFDGVGAQ